MRRERNLGETWCIFQVTIYFNSSYRRTEKEYFSLGVIRCKVKAMSNFHSASIPILILETTRGNRLLVKIPSSCLRSPLLYSRDLIAFRAPSNAVIQFVRNTEELRKKEEKHNLRNVDLLSRRRLPHSAL